MVSFLYKGSLLLVISTLLLVLVHVLPVRADTCVPVVACPPPNTATSGPPCASETVRCIPPATGIFDSEAEAAAFGIQGALDIVNQFFTPKTGFNPAAGEPEVIIGKIIQGAMLMIGVVFGILIIYGGYLWMVARGNEELVKKSIGILQTAVIGFIVVVASYAITSYVIDKVITTAFTP